MHNQSILNILL